MIRLCMLFVCWAALLAAQSTPATDMQLSLLSTVAGKVDYVAADKLQQYYTVSKGYHLRKYSADGHLLYEYGENNLGKITLIDATNPLQLLVYYEEYATVLLLDRTLSPLHRIDLQTAGFWRPQALCLSNDNQLWIYDPQAFVLKKINPRGDVLQESPDLSLLVDTEFQPGFLLESNNRLYLNDPQQGMLVFDNLGNYLKSIPLLNIPQFQIWNNHLVYWNAQHQLQLHDANTLQTQTVQLPFASSAAVLQAVITQERLCLRYPDKIEWYVWKKN